MVTCLFGVRLDLFACIRQQVTLYDPTGQVMLRSSEIYTWRAMSFNLAWAQNGLVHFYSFRCWPV